MKHNIKQTYTQKTEELKLAAGFENISVFSANEPVLLFIRLEAIFWWKIFHNKNKNSLVQILHYLKKQLSV